MLLPFWTSEINLEVPSWFPFGRDHMPVSVNRFHDKTLESIAASCMDLESEFFFMSSPVTGCVGGVPRDKFFSYYPESVFNLGFLMVFAYSELLEKALIFSLEASKYHEYLSIGLTSCGLWRADIFEGKTRVIAIASKEPDYDCSNYLVDLDKVLVYAKDMSKAPDISYYAEKFGYNRFVMNWENINPYELRLSQIISQIEDSSARDVIGASSKMDFPPFFAYVLTMEEE
ncbi:MAG: hypothetical protein IJU31_00225 [Synergistaceae bacterium]|nr:hypothetical protein [Synergistaceae bacterium]